MNLRRLLSIAVLAAALTGCVSIDKVGPGAVVVKQRVAVQLTDAWNQLPRAPDAANSIAWTQDGVTLDLLQLFVGLKNGEQLLPWSDNKQHQQLVFKSDMQAQELIQLFQGFYSRDGSTFELGRTEPVQFLDGPGFKFEFTVLRKLDDVRAAGVAWVTVRNGQLYAMTFTAPKAGFYPRHLPKVEQVAKTARLRS